VELTLVDAELSLVEARQHGANEGPAGLWIGDYDRIRVAKPGCITQFPPQWNRTGNRAKQLVASAHDESAKRSEPMLAGITFRAEAPAPGLAVAA
jgi:hypothetical protein